MRIVLLIDKIPPENKGGAEIVTWRLAQRLHAEGQDVHVISATQQQSFEEIRENIPTYHLKINYPERWRAWLSLYNPQVAYPLAQLLKRLKPDVVHAHNIHTYLTYHALHIAKNAGARVIFTSHDVMPITYGKLVHHIKPEKCLQSPHEYRLPAFYNLRRARLRYNPLRQWAIKRALAQCDVRLAVSQALADVHRINSLPPFEVLHNGLDADAMAVDEAHIIQLRERLGIGERPIALIAGRLTPEKGMMVALEAFERTLERVPDACLLILSGTPLALQVPHAYQHRINTHIFSGGWLEGNALRSAFYLANVVLTPSICFDSFPTVNLEAMSAHRPVIATCHGGSSELVAHDETGYIINPHDIARFSDYLTTLLKSPLQAQVMGQAGYERLKGAFTMQLHVEKTLAHYRGSSAPTPTTR